jgi:asparagine synthase (glutamine-hydrolysing)
VCGICGISGIDDDHVVRRMVAAIIHRGPDDAGMQCFHPVSGHRPVFLGHTRLSILDLSPAGHQPMANADGTVWIVFNGEIYNFRELRRDLEARYRFTSHTDTEVILHLYEEVGSDVVRYLNGMFTFAIYDGHSSTLFLARDQLGIKPLYFWHQQGRFAFASEIKALLATGLCEREIDWQAVWDYFTYLYVPHPQTVFRDIRQLPPGCWLQCDLETGQFRIESYWDPIGQALDRPAGYRPQAAEEFSPEEWSAQVKTVLSDAVHRQMISDVPLGAFLSGGIDSSILVGLMAQHSRQRVKTFTVLFTGRDVDFFNEKDTADAVVQRWDTEHHEIAMDISRPEKMLDLVRCFDQPFGNPTLYLAYLISKATRDHVTVALSGAGGDELFAGYPRYQAVRYGQMATRVPLLPRIARMALSWVPDDFSRPTLRRAKLFFNGLDADFARQYTRWVYYIDETAKHALLGHPSFASRQPSERFIRDYLAKAGSLASPGSGNGATHLPASYHDFMNQVQYVDLKTFLVDNILEYTDRTSMAVALEVRVPFLDYRLVELSQAMPYRYKLQKGRSKAILRQAFAELIPAKNLRAPKKGFCPPLAIWMRDTLDRYFDEHLTRDYMHDHGIFHWEAIQRLRGEHKVGTRDNSMELFGIIMFDVWYRTYVLEQRP